jgi:hypothetical protein
MNSLADFIRTYYWTLKFVGDLLGGLLAIVFIYLVYRNA